MPLIEYNGQKRNVSHPRELKSYPYPPPPPQPLASWAYSLAGFVAMCDGNQFEDAALWLKAEYCYALITDVPEAKRDAFKAWVTKNYPSNGMLWPFLGTGGDAGDFYTDGRARARDMGALI